VDQARELREFAGRERVIRVSSCDESQPLLDILGYRLRQPCGTGTSVETADPERAFLTIDSGFPLANLEETLRGGKPFVHPYPATDVTVLFTANDWVLGDLKGKGKGGVLDSLLHDPGLARLYWAFTRTDANTRNFLRQSPGLANLVPVAPVLDFYGSHICIRNGEVVVPGGAPAIPGWKRLVGASPSSPGEFVVRLLEKDEGWLAAYFDAASRISPDQQAYFTEPSRLQSFYEALRGRDATPGAARPVFRPNAGLLLLMTRAQFEPNGEPHVPGDLEVWRKFLTRKTDSKLVREWSKRATRWNNSQQVIEAMIALSRVDAEDAPVPVFLAVSEIDRGRSSQQRLRPETAALLAEKFSGFSSQYPLFSEFYTLNDDSIVRFFSMAETLDHVRDHQVRADALGLFQANIGFWEILARQGQIPPAKWNDCWQKTISPFADVSSSAELFDAARRSLGEVTLAASGRTQISEDELITLLAGPPQSTAEGQQVRQELADKIRAGMDGQRLVSIDTLFTLANGLSQMAQGNAPSDSMIRLAGQLQEFEMPKPLFSPSERIEWTVGLMSNTHLQSEMEASLPRIIKSREGHRDLAAARGQLTPFLRDSLVGLNYAYYTPPGAQMIYNNPLFVRSHDFAGEMTTTGEQPWRTPVLVGRGWTAGNGAHLAGSLADLPYVLARVEEDFIAPENVQALIWEDLAPCLLTSSILPRWWRVSRDELHAVTLYQRFGEELVSAAADNEKMRARVMPILNERLTPQRSSEIEDALKNRRGDAALDQLAPAESFYLAIEFRRRFPAESGGWGKAGQELENLSQHDPAAVSWQRLSDDFGVPHPALAQTYRLELLNVKPFPTFLGYSSRLMAESWDSNNLYWARLADEMGYSPVVLQRLVPELTHHMVEKIFATDLEDWPALLHALRETGEDFRRGRIASPPKHNLAAGF
jgi:hypothetical protein